MKRLARLAAWLGFAAFSAFATATAMAAGPSVNILKDTDLPGFDYQINKGVTLDQCQKACTGDGLCEEIAPDVFTLLDDGLAYVKEGDKIYATAKGNPQGADGMANIPDNKLDAVIESAEECPGECIFIEP